jgi:hypothetical protein
MGDKAAARAGGLPRWPRPPAACALAPVLRFGADALRNGLDPLAFIRYLDSWARCSRAHALAPPCRRWRRWTPKAAAWASRSAWPRPPAAAAIEDVFAFLVDDCAWRAGTRCRARGLGRAAGRAARCDEDARALLRPGRPMGVPFDPNAGERPLSTPPMPPAAPPPSAAGRHRAPQGQARAPRRRRHALRPRARRQARPPDRPDRRARHRRLGRADGGHRRRARRASWKPPSASATWCRPRATARWACAWCRSARPSAASSAWCATSASSWARRSSSSSPAATPSWTSRWSKSSPTR